MTNELKEKMDNDLAKTRKNSSFDMAVVDDIRNLIIKASCEYMQLQACQFNPENPLFTLNEYIAKKLCEEGYRKNKCRDCAISIEYYQHYIKELEHKEKEDE